jgi:hypothetical protein
MTSTEGKCYSVSEMEAFLTKAGFKNLSVRETTLQQSLLITPK